MSSNLPPKGMRDFLPKEKAIRNFLMGKIREEYTKNGFREIETSEIENIENMQNSDGGENTKLVFQIMKRGEKLDLQKAQNPSDLADLALRFDLTLPLSRFYGNNRNELPTIFKAFQMGYVFRAERPQKGRYRSFMQCDIDIIGDESNLAEIELISTLHKTLKSTGLDHFKFVINDRRILKDICVRAGFEEEHFEDIAISLDKLDKVGNEGIRKELFAKGYDLANIDDLQELNEKIAAEGIAFVKEFSPSGAENVMQIMDVLSRMDLGIEIAFEHSLVRGMGYYTGTIFEIVHKDFNSSIGGGGRYDNMIGKLSGSDAPACGFSIGFERLCDLLMNDESIDLQEKRLALFYDERDDLAQVMKTANTLREEYVVSVYVKKKKFKKQIDRLFEDGFEFMAVYSPELKISKLGE